MGDQFDIEHDIRAATPEDLHELFRISQMLAVENGQHKFSELKSLNYLWRGCARDNAIIWVIGPSDNIKACLYLEVQPVFYSEECQLSETFLYVREDCRKTNYAKNLLRQAKRCAKETGLDLIIGIISHKRLEAKARLYERELPKGGTFFIYRGSEPDEAVAA